MKKVAAEFHVERCALWEQGRGLQAGVDRGLHQALHPSQHQPRESAGTGVTVAALHAQPPGGCLLRKNMRVHQTQSSELLLMWSPSSPHPKRAASLLSSVLFTPSGASLAAKTVKKPARRESRV